MNGYSMDWTTKTFTVTKKFAAEMFMPNSVAFEIVKRAREICPDLQIVNKTNYARHSSKCKLSYDRMEKYISTFEESAILYSEFMKVKQLSRTQPNPYQYVRAWFLEKFPDYECIPDFVDGKLYYTSPLLTLGDGTRHTEAS